MHILQVAPYFPPYIGGQEKYVYYLSKELVRKGHQVMVITSNVPKSPVYEEIDGIQVVRHACLARPLRNPLAPGLAIPRRFMQKFDIIHTHNEHSFASNASVLLKYVLQKPLVITSHGRLVFDSPLADTARKLYWYTVGKTVLSLANRVIVATPSEKYRLVSALDINTQNIDVIPVGVDLDLWDSYTDNDLEQFLSAHNLSDRRVILVATQLIKRKGIHYLIRAIPEITAKHSDIVCVVAGSGDYINELLALVDELDLRTYVHFVGTLNGQELASAYRSAEVFVLPSLGEGQPTCILEAWAFSKPVVATNIEGIVDYYDGTALLTEPGDTKDLAQAIIHLLSNTSYAKTLGIEGRVLTESTFRWKQVTDSIIQVYERALSGHCRIQAS